MIESGVAYDNHERCLCGKPEQGYAMKGPDGKYHPACWNCVRPKNPSPSPTIKPKPVFVPEKDLDL